MSDLTEFRDHCRRMANGGPTPPSRTAYWCTPVYVRGLPGEHVQCMEGAESCRCDCHPRPVPPTDAERALFARLADEIDDYLTPDDEGDDLFGESA